MTRDRLLQIIDGKDPVYGNRVALALNGVIVAAAVLYALQTMESLPRWAIPLLGLGNVLIVAVFAAEYTMRLLTAPRPLHYAVSFWGLIDLAAFLPAVIFAVDDTSVMRTLRLLMVVRIVKLMRISMAADRLRAALADIREELTVFLILSAIVLYLAAVGIHLFESQAQPEAFSSVPMSLWWAVATLTTVGYGDVYPVTTGGRIFTGLVLIIGLAVVSVPVGLLSAALVEGGKPADLPKKDEQD